MTTWYQDIQKMLYNLGGAAHLSKIYNEASAVRKEPLSTNFKATIRRELESNSSDSESFNDKRDLFESVEGIGRGIWGIRGYIGDGTGTPVAEDCALDMPSRKEHIISRIVRDTAVSRKLKLNYKDKCQLCQNTLNFGHRTYSEAHHIRPLGNGHDGPDTKENMLVVCPNCHAKLDYGAVLLSLDDLFFLDNHAVSIKFINYHNSKIFHRPGATA